MESTSAAATSDLSPSGTQTQVLTVDDLQPQVISKTTMCVWPYFLILIFSVESSNINEYYLSATMTMTMENIFVRTSQLLIIIQFLYNINNLLEMRRLSNQWLC